MHFSAFIYHVPQNNNVHKKGTLIQVDQVRPRKRIINYPGDCGRHGPPRGNFSSASHASMQSPSTERDQLASCVSFNLPYKDNVQNAGNGERESANALDDERNGNIPERDASRSQSPSPYDHQHYYPRKRSSIAKLALDRLAKTRERQWSVALSSFIVAITALLMGMTIGFPSTTSLDLTGEDEELPRDYLFSTLLLSLFAVSVVCKMNVSQCRARKVYTNVKR